MTSTTTLATLQPEIIREAQFLLTQNVFMRNLVRTFTVPYGSGKTVNVPFWPSVDAEDKAELESFTDQDLTTTIKTLTVGRAGYSTIVSDEAVMQSADNVIASIGRQAAESIGRKMEQSLTALFPGFSTVIGSNATTITPAHIVQAATGLNALGITNDQLVCVLHPSVAYDLKAALTNTFTNPNGAPAQNTVMSSGYLGSVAGVAVYESSNVAITGGDSVGGLFHRDAIGFALLKDVSIEFERIAKQSATRIVASAWYGSGELVDQYGVAMSFDSSIAA